MFLCGRLCSIQIQNNIYIIIIFEFKKRMVNFTRNDLIKFTK